MKLPPRRVLLRRADGIWQFINLSAGVDRLPASWRMFAAPDTGPWLWTSTAPDKLRTIAYGSLVLYRETLQAIFYVREPGVEIAGNDGGEDH